VRNALISLSLRHQRAYPAVNGEARPAAHGGKMRGEKNVRFTAAEDCVPLPISRQCKRVWCDIGHILKQRHEKNMARAATP
jgi:hypothetical protein